jgi:general L-amino acid transport system permease protein
VSAALARARHLFFGSIANTVLSLVMLALLAAIIVPVFRWAVIDSVVDGTPQLCRASGGACWAFVAEKYRLILFGRYPYAEQWRPLLAMALLAAIILASCQPRLWSRRLVGAQAFTLFAIAVLMWGGVGGLTFVEDTRWGGLPLTLLLAVLGIAGAFPLAIVLALARRSHAPLPRALATAFIEFIRGVPLVSVLFMASFMFPLFLPRGVSIDQLLRALIAIMLFSASYLAEAIRGGLQALPAGQEEAAIALGLPYRLRIWFVVLPQALRAVIPAIVNIFIGILKDTSLVAIVGLMDLLLSTKQALGDPLWRDFSLEAYLFIAAIYFAICLFMSRYSQHLERRLRVTR